jgi:DNA mismatch repair ATPase MutS
METILALITLLSLGSAGIIGYFCYKLLQKVMYMNENIDLLLASVEGFYKHLEHFNSIESYSNEPTILNLMTHSRDVLSDIEDFLGQLDIEIDEEDPEEKK